MIKRTVLCLGMLVAMGLRADTPAPAPTPSQQALQAPLKMDDENPTPGGKSADPGPSGWRALGSLVLVLGLAGGALWALKKWGKGKLPGGGGNHLRVQETLALGDRRFVSILLVDEERFLIATHPAGVTMLSRLDTLETPAGGDFSQALAEQVSLKQPMPVKDMEALIQQNGGQE